MRAVAVVLVLACGCTQTQARKAHRAGEVATAGGLVGVLVAGVVASLVPAHEDAIMTVGLGFVPVSIIGALVYIGTDSKVNGDHPGPTMTRLLCRRTAADQGEDEETAHTRIMAHAGSVGSRRRA